MINKLILFALVITLISCESKKVQDNAILLKQIDSLKSELAEVYKPGCGELMGSNQIHHSKLRFGGINENWKLAEFEIHEINELLDDLKKYQSSRKETEILDMIRPNIENIKSSIESQDLVLFKQEYVRLTKTCNDCHHDTNYGFIEVKIPDKYPLGNQKF